MARVIIALHARPWDRAGSSDPKLIYCDVGHIPKNTGGGRKLQEEGVAGENEGKNFYSAESSGRGAIAWVMSSAFLLRSFRWLLVPYIKVPARPTIVAVVMEAPAQSCPL